MKRVLVVEDDEDGLCLLETSLRRSGYTVVSARNGVEALEKLKKNTVDMIVSDILMPGMDGFEFCRECKKDASLKRIPFVFYTATYTGAKDEEFAMSLGAEKFIAKPCEIIELLRILEAVIKGHENDAPAALKIYINDEKAYLAEHNKRLVEKLEDKVLDLEKEVDRRNRLEKTLDVRARQQAVVADLGHKALLCKDLTGFMNGVVKAIADILDNEYCKVLELLPGGKTMLLQAGVGWKEGLVGHVTVNAGLDSQAGYTLHSGKPVIVEDIRTEKRFSGPLLLHEHNVVSGMSVIIQGQKGPWGALGTHTTRHISYSKDDINFIQAVANILADVIARKQDEEALKESEYKYRSLFNNMLSGFAYCKIIVDENNNPIDFVYLEVNDAFERITGLKKDDIMGKKVTESIPAIKDKNPELFDIYGKVALTGEGTQFEIYFEPLEMWFSISVYSPQEGYFVAVFDDITERKKTEELLKSSSDYLQKLNDSLGAVILTVKIPERVIEYVNCAIENVFGYKPDECIGKKTKIFYPAVEEYQDFGRSLKSAIKEGKNELKVERLYKRKNGEIFPCEVTTTFLKENEKIVRVISILQDVTERKKAEDLLKGQKKALEQKNIALSEILGQIEIEKKQIKDNVIANAENLLLPIIQKLGLKGESCKYVQLLQKNIKELTSSFGKRLTEKENRLTAREIEICNMIKNGLTSKEIAGLLNISLATTEKHRNNIRKKLNVVNKDINLSSVLKTL